MSKSNVVNQLVLAMMGDRKCAACKSVEERLFTDSFTGKAFCAMCLADVIHELTMSPMTEGDNLDQLLKERESLL